jgi:hypothetical protein
MCSTTGPNSQLYFSYITLLRELIIMTTACNLIYSIWEVSYNNIFIRKNTTYSSFLCAQALDAAITDSTAAPQAPK